MKKHFLIFSCFLAGMYASSQYSRPSLIVSIGDDAVVLARQRTSTTCGEDLPENIHITPSNIPNEGILFVDHESAGRSGHGGQSVTEALNGDIIAFYSNVSGTDRYGHSTNGWAEYKISEDGGQTWSEPYILDYSMSLWKETGQSALVDEILTAPNGTIVAIVRRHPEPAEGNAWRSATPLYLRSYDNGRTWSDAREIDPSLQEGSYREEGSLVYNEQLFVLFKNHDPDSRAIELYVSSDNGESFSKRSILPFGSNQWYGTIGVTNEGNLIAYSYNTQDDGQVLQYVISEDEGHTWSEVRITPFAKRIRNPQLSGKIGGYYFMHGRSGQGGEDPWHLVLYTSKDAIHWDNGVFLNKGGDDRDSYSTNAVIGNYDPMKSKKLLIQSSIAYDCGREVSRRVNIHHWWIEVH